MMQTIFDHRSIRRYKETPIAPDVLHELLQAATRASNTGNMQVYSLIVTQDKALREELWQAHFKQEMVRQAPVLITFCADIHRFDRWCLARGAEPGYDNFLWFVNAAIDTLLASQNLALAAEHHGLGICYLGTTTYMAQRIIDILGLPKGVVPVTSLVVGYPDEQPPLTDRLPLEAVVHWDRYTPFDNARIDQLYAAKEALESTQRIEAENGGISLAEVFTTKRYKKSDNLVFSRAYLEVLQRQGFMNHEG